MVRRTIPSPHARACDEYRACDRAHAHASGLHPLYKNFRSFKDFGSLVVILLRVNPHQSNPVDVLPHVWKRLNRFLK